jgi:hypothetical protein
MIGTLNVGDSIYYAFDNRQAVSLLEFVLQLKTGNPLVSPVSNLVIYLGFIDNFNL